MNERGLCLANMEVNAQPALAQCFTLYAALSIGARAVRRRWTEALVLLQKSPRQTANNLMLMDASGNRAVAEIRPEGVHVRRAPGGFRRWSVRIISAAMIWIRRAAADAIDLLHDESPSGSSAPSHWIKSRKMLATAAQGDMTMQSMIFEPGPIAFCILRQEERLLRRIRTPRIRAMLPPSGLALRFG